MAYAVTPQTNLGLWRQGNERSPRPELTMSTLESRFDDAMMTSYKRAKDEPGYNATLFLRMLHDKRGRLTAKQLINGQKPSDGYTALWERQRLDLTVEALVTDNPEWHLLFEPEELAKARKRLADYEYTGSSPQGGN